MSILRWLGLKPEPTGDDDVSTLRKITAELDSLPKERARYVAAFSYVLGRVAHADRDISPEEIREMEHIVREHGKLPTEQAILVVQMAKSQAMLFGSTENFVVTRELRDMTSREEKLTILDSLFAIASADAIVSVVESNEIRQISDELGLEHRDYVGVRSRYRDSLAELKRDEEDDD